MHIDYLIIGQGISGTFLSRELIKAGKKVIVIDIYNANTASRVASGIINPVTGRRVVRTWMIEELLPYAQQAYTELGNDLGIAAARDIDMLTFHTTEEMSSVWHERMTAGEDYLQRVNQTAHYEDLFDVRHGIGITTPCLLVDLPALLPAWRNKLKQIDSLLEEHFDINNCTITNDGIYYNGIKADKLILCDGINGFDTPYFSKLPYALSKGEAMLVSIPELPPTNIYKQGMSLVPLNNGIFWVGSSFEWDFEHANPTEGFRQKVTNLLNGWLKLPFEIVEHRAAIRPASLERRPFVGMHPKYNNIGIFNGMGTKGCSLAPYFAHQFVQQQLWGSPIHSLADISRFTKILSI